MADLSNPVDSLLRGILSSPEEARDLIHENAPARYTKLLADTPPELMSENFVHENFRNSQSDLLFKAEFREGGDIFFYFLFVYGAELPPDLSLLLAEYHIQILKKFAKKSEDECKLPLVIPIVISTAKNQAAESEGLTKDSNPSESSPFRFAIGGRKIH